MFQKMSGQLYVTRSRKLHDKRRYHRKLFGVFVIHYYLAYLQRDSSTLLKTLNEKCSLNIYYGNA